MGCVTPLADRGIIRSIMEITIRDSNSVPLPPDETRIVALRAEPWPDRRRVAVDVEITPFQQRPNLHISIQDTEGREVGSVGAMQIRQTKMSFTVHVRRPDTPGQYTVSAFLAYVDTGLGIVDQAQIPFEIP